MKRVFGLLLIGLMAFAVVASGCIGGGGTTTTSSSKSATTPTSSSTTTTKAGGKVVWASTQLVPPAERAFILNTVLPDFKKQTGIDVQFVPISQFDLSTRLAAEEKSGKVTISVVGDLHGALDYYDSEGWLMDLSNMPELKGRTFISTFEKYSVIRGKKVYIPWMSATYVMVVNKEAFQYLPDGLTQEDVMKGTDKWTYDAFLAWSKNIHEKTGKKLVGFPVKGLFHRFLHGYLYPSYTGYEVKKFESSEAIEMWNYLKDLWQYVNPSSTTWDEMADPLLRGDVLIAWDHTARIKDAITKEPDKFVVVPVPRGPKGRGFILVVAGLAIPKGAPNKDAAWKLIDYLTTPKVQAETLSETGFFPVVEEASEELPEGPLKVLAKGVAAQESTSDALVVMIPNLGEYGGQFGDLYKEAFRRIVLEGQDPEQVTKDVGAQLHNLFQKAGVPEP
ncbi:ABC transporter substrate-binding protein [Thermococcus guaymasensis DSM 11113]|uniref:ABC transporter substrate-binding protein n=1 Tax=Thermococcus guaymasensis DSM 11113 TaxID=1432656 RepID=A0A0X1KI00_9EURY|nr:ABC transporter substrate-binding protein [Thermococcus guaymasensis]AJC70870.1 ABC transporter substrate-binding protein [Thermococcus guaymasensis DSM 11113]